jgi:hypothetical protein
VTFPGIDGASGGGADTAAPYEAGYDWSGSSDASGPRAVTAANVAGLSASSDFALIPDLEGPTELALTLSTDRRPGAPVRLEIDLGSDSGAGVDRGSLVVERDSAPVAEDGCGAFEDARTRVKLVDSADTSVAGTDCYRYRIKVSDKVGNVSKSKPTDAVAIDSSPATTPSLTLSESSPDLFVSGTTLYFRSKGGQDATFSVATVTNDPESGIRSVTFPDVPGAKGGGVDDAAPYEATYHFAGSLDEGKSTVVATNGSGLSARSEFVLVADDTAPAGAMVELVEGPVYFDAVQLAVETGKDSGSGLDPESVVLERDDTPLEDGECGSFTSSWRAVKLDGDSDTSVQPGHCYRYRVGVSDNVGNRTTSAPSKDAIVIFGESLVGGLGETWSGQRSAKPSY